MCVCLSIYLSVYVTFRSSVVETMPMAPLPPPAPILTPHEEEEGQASGLSPAPPDIGLNVSSPPLVPSRDGHPSSSNHQQQQQEGGGAVSAGPSSSPSDSRHRHRSISSSSSSAGGGGLATPPFPASSSSSSSSSVIPPHVIIPSPPPRQQQPRQRQKKQPPPSPSSTSTNYWADLCNGSGHALLFRSPPSQSAIFGRKVSDHSDTVLVASQLLQLLDHLWAMHASSSSAAAAAGMTGRGGQASSSSSSALPSLLLSSDAIESQSSLTFLAQEGPSALGVGAGTVTTLMLRLSLFLLNTVHPFHPIAITNAAR